MTPDGAPKNSPSPPSSASQTPKRVVIGEIVGPFGHKGEVKVYPHTDFPDRLLDLKSVTLRAANGTERQYPVKASRFHKNVILMQLEGVPTMNDADVLRGMEIVVAPEDRVALPDEDVFYVDDLVGMKVVTDEGQELGTIRQVLRYPANDVYEVGNLLIPAIRDVIVGVDLDAGVVTIHPIPGLLDEPEVA